MRTPTSGSANFLTPPIAQATPDTLEKQQEGLLTTILKTLPQNVNWEKLNAVLRVR
jgi:hypothetical protein